MTNYFVKTKDEQFSVRATTYQNAANAAARLLNKGKRRLVAIRTTGDPHKSGYFQGYVPTGDGLNSTGPAFHIM